MKIEATRLKSTNVAVSMITSCIREKRFSETDFVRISSSLLVAIRMEVEAITLDPEGIHLNATLMAQDSTRTSHLTVLNRANSDRLNSSYPKEELLV